MPKKQRSLIPLDVEISVKIAIPGKHLLDLAKRVRARFDLAASEPVAAEDLLIQAGIQGIVDLPSDWSCETDEQFTDEELEDKFL